MIFLYIVINSFYLIAVTIVWGNSLGRWGQGLMFVFALMFRMSAWPLAAPFSDDIYRYRWEGKLQANGGNPYQARPLDEQWRNLRDETWPKVGSKDVKAGYGPLAELVERWSYALAERLTNDPVRQAHWMKMPSALFDLASIGLLWLLLARRAVPVERMLIYVWAPAPVLEFWGTGHNDSIVICFLLLALLGAAHNKWTGAYTALGAAAAVKLWPLLLIPAFFSVRRGWQFVAAPAVFVAMALPYWSNVDENIRFMSGFIGGWRNNDSLFGILLWMMQDEFNAKCAAFALLSVATLIIALKRWPLEQKCALTIASLLVVAANVHPWYMTWFLPLLALIPCVPLFIWLTLAPLFYVVLIEWNVRGVWDGSSSLRWWVYIPVLLSALSISSEKTIRWLKTKWISTFVT